VSRTHKDSPQSRPDRSARASRTRTRRYRNAAARRAVNIALVGLRYGVGPTIRYAAEVAA
jgi:hypothetical protein